MLVLVLLLAGIAALVLLQVSEYRDSEPYLVPLFAACVAGFFTYFANPYFTDVGTAIRYSCPVLLAVIPFVIASVGRIFRGNMSSEWDLSYSIVPAAIAGSFVVLCLFQMFGSALQERFTRIVDKRTLISFPINDFYEAYLRFSLSEKARNLFLSAQEATEPGTGILAWVSQPYHFNFSRNPVIAASEPALMVPWLDLPINDDISVFKAYLQDRGIRYVIWERSGIGVREMGILESRLNSADNKRRRFAEKNILFRNQLGLLMGRSTIIFELNQLVVIDIVKEEMKMSK
jgi:hypothetical protein